MSELTLQRKTKIVGGVCIECGELTISGRKVCAKCKANKKEASNWFPVKKTDGYYLPFLKNQLRKWDSDSSKAAKIWANTPEKKRYFND